MKPVRSSQSGRDVALVGRTLICCIMSVGVMIAQPIVNDSPSSTSRTSAFRSGASGDEPLRLAKGAALGEKTLTGAAAGDGFGTSVAGAGDVNGDGYADVIVGAYGNDAAASDAGRAYIFLGGLGFDNGPDVIMTGDSADDWFGFSVASLLDVNGDGFDDVIVGAYLNDAVDTSSGRAYIFLGGKRMDHTSDLTLTGAAKGDEFGRAIASAGDVNGDGHPDIVVGAWGNSANGNLAGRAYVYFGGPGMDNAYDLTIGGSGAGSRFGSSVASAGDINGDGYADLLIGAIGAGGTGNAYLYFGGASMDTVVDVTFSGQLTTDFFGGSVASAGDVNADGYPDILIGAHRNDAFGSDVGRAYIFLGGESMDNTADVTMTGESSSNWFGYSVCSAGDLNMDGFDDVIVGAYGNVSYRGRAYVYFGSDSPNNQADAFLTGVTASDQFGVSVATVGDMNGDGYPDVIVGANGNDAGGSGAGRAYVYFNALTGADIPDRRISGGTSGYNFAFSVSGAGDVNGDGYSDMIVGAHSASSGAGRAFVYIGGPGMDDQADLTLIGSAGDSLGRSVSSAGDVNGDGYDDVIVGATGNDAGGTDAGCAFIYFGGNSMDNTADVTVVGGAAGDAFGYSVSGAGDVNGDGYSDVIIGANGCDAGGANAGRMYIYFGGASMNSTQDVVLTGAAAGDLLGTSVSDAGDVNGDGYADVVVGAYCNDNGGTNAGIVFVLCGGAAMDTSPDATLTGAAAGDAFGFSVSGAGDMNADGYGDFVVGAYGNDAGGDDAGRAYLCLGGPSLRNASNVVLTGVAPDDYFGWTVSSVGDVNADGYADLIIGATGNDAGGNSAGRAYVFFGGALPDSIPDVILTGVAAADAFGASLSCIGDVNEDGYDDIIVGAYGNDEGGTDAGMAYIYLSSSPAVLPYLISVTDVPNDQGGVLLISWMRSAYDVRGISRITSYIVERSTPPGTRGFLWEEIATVTARRNTQYATSASTLYDSIDGNSGILYFRVTALTSNPDEYWRSMTKSGHSVDNLSPSSPAAPGATPLEGGPTLLSWGPNTTDPDVGAFVIYRSTTGGFSPGVSNRIATTSDTCYVDSTTSVGQTYYYRITTRDIHGNESIPTSELSVVALAVELTSLSAVVLEKNSVLLQWRTASEISNAGFEVQRRSSRESEWRVLGVVEGSGSSGQPHDYSFRDILLPVGQYAYRLRQLNTDGSSAFSWSVSAVVDAPRMFGLLQNYPNPFNPVTTFEYELPAEAPVEWKVFDNLGRQVETMRVGLLSAGYYRVVFDARELPSGVYWFLLKAGDDSEAKKMVVVK